jgi:hypothetical protein
LLLTAVLLLSVSGFADAIVNNFTGYNDYWHSFGDQLTDTQTYGEIFTVPTGETYLTSFSFFTGHPIDPGNIVLGAYIAEWNGDRLGNLLYDSGKFTYDNAGDEELTFNTGGVFVNPGQKYMIFLSTTQFSGESVGSTYFSTGSSNDALNGFSYYNNGNNWVVLFATQWQGYGLSPDLAVNLDFQSVPEPGSLVFLGTGIVGLAGILRNKLF